MVSSPPLLRVCRWLNEASAKYLICGAQGCILHGLVRTTEDVDILVEATEENCQRVIDGLARMEDGAAKELTGKDILENVVVKVADEVEVDVIDERPEFRIIHYRHRALRAGTESPKDDNLNEDRHEGRISSQAQAEAQSTNHAVSFWLNPQSGSPVY